MTEEQYLKCRRRICDDRSKQKNAEISEIGGDDCIYSLQWNLKGWTSDHDNSGADLAFSQGSFNPKFCWNIHIHIFNPKGVLDSGYGSLCTIMETKMLIRFEPERRWDYNQIQTPTEAIRIEFRSIQFENLGPGRGSRTISKFEGIRLLDDKAQTWWTRGAAKPVELEGWSWWHWGTKWNPQGVPPLSTTSASFNLSLLETLMFNIFHWLRLKDELKLNRVSSVSTWLGDRRGGRGGGGQVHTWHAFVE